MSKPEGKGGLGEAVGQVGARLIEGLQLRLELAGLELGEEKDRLLAALIGALVATVLVFVGLLTLNILIAFLFWEQRVLVFSVLTAVYLGGGVLLGIGVRSRIKSAPRPFAATIEELRKDAGALRSKDRGGS